jgi:Holliday junction resolvase RusA-like endonuclease
MVNGRMRYTGAYASGREAWGLVVLAAVPEAGWATPDVKRRLAVSALVWGGGKRDLDRVGTAVLDALQNGTAIKDDCLVDNLHLIRYRPERGEPQRIEVRLSLLDGE